MKIDDRLAQIKSTTVKFQGIIEQKQQRVTDLSHTLFRAINLLVVSVTALLVVVAAGQVLLIYVCWEYVRGGRFRYCASRRAMNPAAPDRQYFIRRVCAASSARHPYGSVAR